MLYLITNSVLHLTKQPRGEQLSWIKAKTKDIKRRNLKGAIPRRDRGGKELQIQKEQCILSLLAVKIERPLRAKDNNKTS